MAKAKNVETEVLDPKEAKKEAYKAAKARLRSFMAECEDVDLKADLVTVVGLGNRGGGGGGGRHVASTKTSAIKKIVADGSATEDDIWNEFKLGRAEMRVASIDLIKRAKKPEERVWISFDPENGLYNLVAKGADVPEGWTGYRPVDVEDIEL